MKITNKANLPEIVYNAIVRKQHKSGDYSASMLDNPTQLTVLYKRYYDKIEIDASDLIWSLMGTSMHNVIQQGETKDDLAEEYIQHPFTINGKVLMFSGSADLYRDKEISDWKMDSVYTIMNSSRDKERAGQVNSYAFLFRSIGFEVEKLSIWSFIRDYSKTKARTQKDYPKRQVIQTKMPVWTPEETEKHIVSNITRFEEHIDTPDDQLPPCTMEERWQDPTIYAVMKKGRKSAVKRHESKEEAKKMVSELGATAYIEERPSTPRRCEDYCSVSNFCKQYQKIKGNTDGK